jgi:hypothetical protein
MKERLHFLDATSAQGFESAAQGLLGHVLGQRGVPQPPHGEKPESIQNWAVNSEANSSGPRPAGRTHRSEEGTLE